MTEAEESAEIEILTLRLLPEIAGIMEQVYTRAKTPIGGLCFLAGWALSAAAWWRAKD